MKITFLIRHYPIFAIILPSILLVGILPFIGNSWAQQRGLVIPEPADVAPPANATNSSTIMMDKDINVTSHGTVVNNTIEVPSNITNTPLESGLPQSNQTANESDKGDMQLSSGPQSNVTDR